MIMNMKFHLTLIAKNVEAQCGYVEIITGLHF